MSKDNTFLYDAFNAEYDAAKRYEKAGRSDLAKRAYLSAAEKLLEIAKTSTPKTKAAQIERSKRIIEYAEKLPAVGTVKKPTSAARPTDDDDEENGKIWTGANIPDIGFDDIAGLDDVKKSIRQRMIDPLKYPEQYSLYGKRSGGGVLLYGPPGTGKTMMARAIAHEVGATFFCVKSSDILSKWVGESEQNINSLFEAARGCERAIIFIDEMDSLFATRGSDAHNDKRVNEFLQQIDGFAGKNPNILLLGATNRPWDVDSAAVRSGRFGERIYVSLPDAKARLFMFMKNIGDAPYDKAIDWKKLLTMSAGYSGADIAEICDRAKNRPLKEYIATGTLAPITESDLVDALLAIPKTVTDEELMRFEKYAGIRGEKASADASNATHPTKRK